MGINLINIKIEETNFSRLTKQNKKNLIRLKKLIEKVPLEKFDMGTYRQRKRIYMRSFVSKTPRVCNTIGCAMGYATVLVSPERYKYLLTDQAAFDFQIENIYMRVAKDLFNAESNEEYYRYLFSDVWEDHVIIDQKTDFLNRLNKVITLTQK